MILLVIIVVILVIVWFVKAYKENEPKEQVVSSEQEREKNLKQDYLLQLLPLQEEDFEIIRIGGRNFSICEVKYTNKDITIRIGDKDCKLRSIYVIFLDDDKNSKKKSFLDATKNGKNSIINDNSFEINPVIYQLGDDDIEGWEGEPIFFCSLHYISKELPVEATSQYVMNYLLSQNRW